MQYITCIVIGAKVIWTYRFETNGRWVDLSADSEESLYTLMAWYTTDNDILEKTAIIAA